MIFSILTSSPYRNSKQWTWNPFRPRFWSEWTVVYESERVYERIYDQYKPSVGFLSVLSELKEKSENYDSSSVLPKGINYSDNSRQFLLENGYIVDGYRLSPSLIPYDDIKPIPLLSNDLGKFSELTFRRVETAVPVILEDSQDSSEALASFGVVNSQVLSQLDDVRLVPNEDGSITLKKNVYEPPATQMDLIKHVQPHHLLPAFKPTPKHFDLIPFDEVVKAGFDLNDRDIVAKGSQLQLCVSILLLFVLFFLINALSAIFQFVIASVVVGEIMFSYLVSAGYQTTLVALTSFLYFYYLHLFWQYDTNRFGTVYSFWQAIKSNPKRLLPINQRARPNV